MRSQPKITHTRASGFPLTLSHATYQGGKGLLVLSFEATSYRAGCCWGVSTSHPIPDNCTRWILLVYAEIQELKLRATKDSEGHLIVKGRQSPVGPI